MKCLALSTIDKNQWTGCTCTSYFFSDWTNFRNGFPWPSHSYLFSSASSVLGREKGERTLALMYSIVAWIFFSNIFFVENFSALYAMLRSMYFCPYVILVHRSLVICNERVRLMFEFVKDLLRKRLTSLCFLVCFVGLLTQYLRLKHNSCLQMTFRRSRFHSLTETVSHELFCTSHVFVCTRRGKSPEQKLIRFIA